MKKVMNDFPSADEPWFSKILPKVPQYIVSRVPRSFVNTLVMLKMPRTAIFHMIDLTRDIIFLFELSLSQGGYIYMMTQSYVKGVSSILLFFAFWPV